MKYRYFLVPAAILVVWTAWVLALIHFRGSPLEEQAVGVNPFEILGTFGDSFGAIASLMATLAAAGALLAFAHQRESSEAQQFESNFFALLGHFQQVVSQLDVHSYKPRRKRGAEHYEEDVEILRTFTGRDALRRMLYIFRRTMKAQDFSNVKNVCSRYDAFYNTWSDDLGHYFRILYHIVRLVHEKCPGEVHYYMRLIRAHLSNSELILLAYNSVCGEGRDVFVDYVVQYSLLHNLHRNSGDVFAIAELDFFLRKIPEPAFRFTDLPEVTFDGRIPKTLPCRNFPRWSLF